VKKNPPDTKSPAALSRPKSVVINFGKKRILPIK
jgi:hypothetical protein